MFSKFAHWFATPKGQAVEHAIENAVIEAGPIVAEISVLVPNRTFEAINTAYQKYAVSFAMTEQQLSDPVQQGLALRELAVNVLKRNHQDTAINVLNAAVELAVVASSVNTSVKPAPTK
jgi:hypothetical protein